MTSTAVITIAAVVTAAGVAYLALSEFERRAAAADFADRVSDPNGYTAREWAKRADLDCELVLNVEVVTTQGGFLRPMSFSCLQPRGGLVSVKDVDCPADSPDVPSGRKTADGLYHPAPFICWSVTP